MRNINEQIFNEFFSYQYPSFLVKDLYEDNQNKNNKIVKNINESFINLRNSINSKEIPENKNLKKVINIDEKILDFNKEQKGKGFKILTPKQMLQRIPIALAQIKAGNTSENLLNEIRQIIYSYILCIEKKKLLKKYITI